MTTIAPCTLPNEATESPSSTRHGLYNYKDFAAQQVDPKLDKGVLYCEKVLVVYWKILLSGLKLLRLKRSYVIIIIGIQLQQSTANCKF